VGSFSAACDWLGVQRAWTRTRGSHDVLIADVDTAVPDDGASSGFAAFTGVAPGARLLPVRYAPSASTHALDLGQAIEYAVEHGACIVNIAPGADLATTCVQRAIQYAATRNALVVCAARLAGESPLTSNDAANLVRVLGVDAGVRPVSNYPAAQDGPAAHLAAPSFTRKRSDGGDAGDEDEPVPAAAQAFVSGCAALIKALNPGWGYHEIREHLLASGTPRTELDGHCSGGSLLNAANAVLGPIELAGEARSLTWSALNDATLHWNLRYRSALCVNVVALYRSHGDAHWRELAFARAGSLRMTVPAASLRRSSGVLRLACRESNFHADDIEITIR
jgi:subtilisin family serine protease